MWSDILRNSGFNETDPVSDTKRTISGHAVKKSLSAGDYIAFLFGESPALQVILSGVNWLPVSIILGMIIALTRLILITNPSVCYLYAKDQVNGYEVTLPEAMATARAWSWFGLILTPLLITALLSIIAWLMRRINRWLGGKGSFHLYLGIITCCTSLFILGQIIGYIIVNTQDLKSLNDLRDLTPGVSLGLLPLLAAERIGRFFHEVVRGFDLFGIWVILFLAAMVQAIENFTKGKSLLMAVIYYGVFIAIRWVIEVPGSQLWYYFWNVRNF